MKNRNSKFAKGLVCLHIGIIFVSFAGVLSKLIDQPLALTVAGRALVAFLTLRVAAVFLRIDTSIVNRRDTIILFLLGIVLAFHWLFFFAGIRKSSVAIGVLSFSTYPSLVLLFEAIHKRKLPSVAEILMVLGAIGGIALLNPPSSSGFISAGVFYGVLSGALYAFILIANHYMAGKYGGLLIGLHEQRAAGIILLPFLLWSGLGLTGKDILLIVILGVVCTAFAYTLFIQGCCWVNPRTASLINCLEPLYSIFYAFLIFGEMPGYTALAGGVLILLSSIFAQLQEYRGR